MRIRNTAVQIAVMIVAAAAIAVIANGFASRTRRLNLPGYWPNAQRVPPREAEVVPPPARTTTVGTTAVAGETPAAPGVIAPTTTTAAPVTTTVAQTTTTTPHPAPPTPHPTTPTPHPAPPTPTPQPPTPTFDLAKYAPHPDKPYVEISGDEAQGLHAKGVLVLDARRTSVYEEGHIPGARSFSVWESDVDEKVNALFNERSDPREQNLPIVIYCSGGACEDSHMLAQKLWGIQFNNVYVYKDGFPDWQKRGLPVKTGANP